MSWWEVFKVQIVTPTTKISQRKEPVEEEDKDCCEQAMQKWISRWKEMGPFKVAHLSQKLRQNHRRNGRGDEHIVTSQKSLTYLPDYIKDSYSKPCYVFYSVLRNGEQQAKRRMTTMWPHNLWDFIHVTAVWDLERLLHSPYFGIGGDFHKLCVQILDEWEDCDEEILNITGHTARKYFHEGD